jgi:hypothetical protein
MYWATASSLSLLEALQAAGALDWRWPLVGLAELVLLCMLRRFGCKLRGLPACLLAALHNLRGFLKAE